ncbi:MAG: hypothetical protein R2831_05930 [Chitinophagaceae bacterium]
MKNYKKEYELTNHLVNVMAVVSDKVVEEEDPTTARRKSMYLTEFGNRIIIIMKLQKRKTKTNSQWI